MDVHTTDYYDGIADGYDGLYAEEQIQKLELVGKEMPKYFILNSYTLLDVGCGTGISTAFFKVKEKHGIDPSRGLLRKAIYNYPSCKFLLGSAEKLPYKDMEFDIVVSFTAIQNFTDISKGVSEIKRVGKRFILTFLKKSEKKDLIEQLILTDFKVIKRIEESKDIIYFCE